MLKRYNRSSSAHALTWVLAGSVILFFSTAALGHGVGRQDQGFLTQMSGVHVGPFMYLGAKHMVTGYDHLLYLVGVIFFLSKLRNVVTFVSLFAVGHSITLLAGVLSGVQINPNVIDAIIGLSVCYKALENLGTIRLLDPRGAVFWFGLAHGFGLSSKLQDLSLSPDGLIANMISFNLGVEVGQVLALGLLFSGLAWLRTLAAFPSIALNANVILFACGVTLFGLQVAGLIMQ